MKKATRNWLLSAEYDLESAQKIFLGGRYLHVILFCHTALEKILKALISHQDTDPPYSHNLLNLADKTGLEIPNWVGDFLTRIDRFHLPVRYPEEIREVRNQFDEGRTERYLRSTEEVFKWLKNRLN